MSHEATERRKGARLRAEGDARAQYWTASAGDRRAAVLRGAQLAPEQTYTSRRGRVRRKVEAY